MLQPMASLQSRDGCEALFLANQLLDPTTNCSISIIITITIIAIAIMKQDIL